MLDTGLFDGFDQAQIAAIKAARFREIEQTGRAKALKTSHKMQMRRAKSKSVLSEILPPFLEDGESYHVISHGDIDSLSYLEHFVNHAEFFHYVAISTWCMGRTDLDQIEGWIESGRVENLALYVGEIFPSQYGDEYARAIELSERYEFRLVVARNHSKIMLCDGGGGHLVIESSANVNTNPRIEQTAIHASRDLFDFYREFFDGLKTIDRRR